MNGFSRREWARIVRSVEQDGFVWGPGMFCFVCGKRWGRAACPHTHEDNHEMAELVRSQTS